MSLSLPPPPNPVPRMRCRKPFAGRDELAGKSFHCPRCKSLIKAPVPPEFTLLRPPLIKQRA